MMKPSRPDFIVIRGTRTQMDGTWHRRPDPKIKTLGVVPGVNVRRTMGLEVGEGGRVAEVWKPAQGGIMNGILFKEEATYGHTATAGVFDQGPATIRWRTT